MPRRPTAWLGAIRLSERLKALPGRLRGRPEPDNDIAAQPAPAEDETGTELVACVLGGRDPLGELALPLEQAGLLARDQDAFVWVRLESPGAELPAVGQEFEVPEPALAEATRNHRRPLLEVHADALVAVLKPLYYSSLQASVEVTEIDLILGPGFTVTVEDSKCGLLAKVRAATGAQTNLDAASVLWCATELAVESYLATLERIDVDVEALEQQVFGVASTDHAEDIYKLKREVAEFRRMVTPLLRALARLKDGQIEAIVHRSADFEPLHEDLLRVADGIDGVDRLLSDILDANLARVSVEENRISLRQNEDMRKISAWAAIALVPAATAGIYGMNFEHMPELGWRYSYPAALLGIATVCTLLYRAFRRNHWL